MIERLKIIIQNSGLSQKTFALNIGISGSAITEFLKGRSKTLSAEVLLSIHKNFNVNINWLLTGEGDMFLNKSPDKETPVYTFEEIDKTWDKKKSPEEEAEFKALVGKGLYPIDEDNIHHTIWFNKLNKFQQWLVAAINTRGVLDDDMLRRLRTWIEMENEMKEAIDKNQSGMDKKGEAG